jgi:hypothetical protein
MPATTPEETSPMLDHPALRLVREQARLSRVLARSDQARFLGALLRELPSVVRTRKLTAADDRMLGRYRVRYHGTEIVIPAGEIDGSLAGSQDGSTFGGVREMFGNDVYLWPFEPGLRARTALDLGANRGLFTVLALAALGAERVVRVEPQKKYEAPLAALLRANGVAPSRVEAVWALCGVDEGPADAEWPTVTMRELLEKSESGRFDFVKMDIEGGEFPIFERSGEWLDRCDNLAMELHPERGDVRIVTDALTKHGFTWLATDARRHPARGSQATYAYASKVGALVRG